MKKLFTIFAICFTYVAVNAQDVQIKQVPEGGPKIASQEMPRDQFLRAPSQSKDDCTVTSYPYNVGFEDNDSSFYNCWEFGGYYSFTENIFIRNGGLWTNANINSAHSGSANLVISDGTEDWDYYGYWVNVFTPVLDFSSVTSPVLKFWYSQEAFVDSVYGAFQDTLIVYYRPAAPGSGADPADTSFLEIFKGTNNVTSWTQVTLPLSNSSSTSEIVFQVVMGGGFGVTLDDVTIEAAGGSGVKKYANANIAVYPNPAKGYFNVKSESEITQIEVYNLMGQKVYSTYVGDNSYTVNTSDFSGGMYIVKVISTEGTVVQKLSIAK